MTFEDKLRASRNFPIAAFHRFKLSIQTGEASLHLFVEGHDDKPFYVAFVSRRVSRSHLIRVHKCKNKDGVLRTLQLIARQGTDQLVLFFVDKDLSDYIGDYTPTNPSLFVTDTYSIENYVVDSYVVSRFLNDFVRCEDGFLTETDIVKQFRTQYDRFVQCMIVLMSWVIYLKRSGQHPNLSNLDLSKLFSIDSYLVFRRRRVGEARSRVAFLDKTCNVTTPRHAFGDIANVAREIRGHPAKGYIRGKFDAWFMSTFLNRLVEALVAQARESKQTVRVTTQVHVSNLVELFSPRIVIPPHLATFLDQHLPENI
jgi:hypothetical protein